jgi:erythritol kinase (D-erythritol 1-phosphate-forming)
MVAAVSIGRYPDIAAACVDWVDPLLGDLDEPDPALQRRYDALFPIYREAYGHMGGVWRGLDRVRREF